MSCVGGYDLSGKDRIVRKGMDCTRGVKLHGKSTFCEITLDRTKAAHCLSSHSLNDEVEVSSGSSAHA